MFSGLLADIAESIRRFLCDVVFGMLLDLFDSANAQINSVGATVGMSPQAYNNNIFTLMRNLSDNVMLPIASLIITGILCYELITMVTEKNNMHDVDTFMFFKYLFKACIAVFILSNTFVIVNGVFDLSNVMVQGVRKKKRPYKTQNYYDLLIKQADLDKEVKRIVKNKKFQTDGKTKKSD